MSARVVLLVALLMGAVGPVAHAADGTTENPESLNLSAALAAMSGVSPPSDGPEEAAYPEFSKVTAGMERIKPQEQTLFILWRHTREAVEKGKSAERLLAQIPSNLLGEQFMLSTSFAGGGFFTGFPLNEAVVRWEQHDRQLVLVQPETGYITEDGKEVSDVVRRTHPDRIRVALPILTKAPNGDPVIDLGELLKSDFADIGWTVFNPMMPGMPGAARVNPQLSKWATVKPFELNVEIGVDLALAMMQPQGAHEKKRVHFSFWKLARTDYQPRVADPRIGYFLTANQDWSKPLGERDIFNRYINRWHLVKRDPSLKQCEPKQPIVYYIEKTVPIRHRQAVRDGILEWNKAFAKIGFVNAIEVRQQTDDNEWKDLDPEDMRYSFFRWIVTGAGFAMGPSRANPFTGQIYDADIIFDDSMVRFLENEAQRMIPAAMAMQKLDHPVLEGFLAANPQWQRPTRPWEMLLTTEDIAEQELRARAEKRLHACGNPTCDYMHGMKHQMALAKTALAGQPPEVIDRFVYDVVKEVVMHEVGHTLGLRHNFKASTIYTLEEIQKRRTTGEATVGSVMDYNPALLFGDNVAEGHFITPTVGPYDYWAIEYGYRPFDGSAPAVADAKPSDEKKPDEAKPADAPTAVQAVSINDIPADVRAQLPAEVLKAIESGQMNAAGGAPSGKGAMSMAGAPAGELEMLQQIARRSAEPELAYSTDEDTTPLGPDPRSNRFDCGADPVAWAKARLALVDKRLNDVLEWSVKDQESWSHLRGAVLTLLMEKAMVFDYVGRYVGGQYFNRSHRGDPNAAAPLVTVESKLQRDALRFTVDTLYKDTHFALPADVLNHMASARWMHDGAPMTFVVDFPVHEFISTMQWWNLFDRLFPDTLRRIQDNEMRTLDADKLTVAEYIRTLQQAVWSDATDAARLQSKEWTDATPFLSSIRRSLQREYLGLVEPIVRDRPGRLVPPDIHAMLTFSLQKLAADLQATAGLQRADFASQAHLATCKARIDRMLAAELKEFEPRASMSMMPMGQTAESPVPPMKQ